mmetsp:Transcript_17768/g.27482  ORF Transcript_17768/g.27482 Transcript_17768/m.27482 type:complete len:146 (-) Transcript_17768:960-1397(-)
MSDYVDQAKSLFTHKLVKHQHSDILRMKTPQPNPQVRTTSTPLDKSLLKKQPLNPDRLERGEIDDCMWSLDIASNSLDDHRNDSYLGYSNKREQQLSNKKKKRMKDIVKDFASVKEHMFRMTKGRQIKKKMDWRQSTISVNEAGL